MLTGKTDQTSHLLKLGPGATLTVDNRDGVQVASGDTVQISFAPDDDPTHADWKIDRVLPQESGPGPQGHRYFD